MNPLQKYYSKTGNYLTEHKNYFTDEILKKDLAFIIKTLILNKKDQCLDLQCANGRLTIPLNEAGYNVDGVDFSSHMINIARQTAKEKNLDIDFFIQDLHKFKIPKQYTKVFLYFPDWNDLDFEIILPRINSIMKKGGLFLYDHDNLFRLLNYLAKNDTSKNKYSLDAKTMLFKNNTAKYGDRYFSYPEIENIFHNNGFKIIATYGNTELKNNEYKYNSQRLRIIAKKI